MPVIKNKLNERKTIRLREDKAIVLLAKGTLAIDQRDMESPSLQQLIEKGEVVVLGEEKKSKKEPSIAREKDKQ